MSYASLTYRGSAMGGIEAVASSGAGDAIYSLMKSSDFAGGASPFSKLITASVGQIAGAAGVSIQNLSQDLLSSSSLVNTAGDIAPILGTALKLAGFVAQAQQVRSDLEKQSKAEFDSGFCIDIAAAKVNPTGSLLAGGTNLPGNLFYPVKVKTTLGNSLLRPYAGQILITLTEGYDAGGLQGPGNGTGGKVDKPSADGVAQYEQSYKHLINCYNKNFEAIKSLGCGLSDKGCAVYDMADCLNIAPGASVKRPMGISEARRAIYKKLRQAMQVQGGLDAPPGSDGGASIWPLYLDMILQDVDSGKLSKDFLNFLMTRDYVYKGSRPRFWMYDQNIKNCVYPAVDSVWKNTIDLWRTTVHPTTTVGQAALKKILDAANCIQAKHKWDEATGKCITVTKAQVDAITTILTTQYITKKAPPPAPKPSIKDQAIVQEKKMSPAVAIAIGVGVAAAGAAAFMFIPKKRR